MKFRLLSFALIAIVLFYPLPPASRAADAPSGASLRTTVLLDGDDWESARTTAPQTQVPTQGWSKQTVPGTTFLVPDWTPHYIWYRKTVSIPAAWAGRRVFAYVGGARNAPQVFIDGVLAGGQLDGWTPLRVEITSLVHPGASSILTIRCQDRSATVAPEKLAAVAPGSDPAHQATIAPIGGYHDLMGVWDSVRLETTPQDEIVPSDLVITPSFRKQSLTLQGRIDSHAANLWVSAQIFNTDGKSVALDVPGGAVAADGTWQIAAAFPGAHDWSPEDPYLYHLTVTLHQGSATGPVLDAYDQRFGFKEVWIVGPDIYINGAKRHLLASATWPVADPVPADVIRERIKSARDSNAICFRLHTGPWREEWLNAADEAGLLIVDEAAVYTDGDGLYAYNDPRFWRNYHDHIAGMIRRDRNHASLVLYSLENETLFMGNQKYDNDLPDQFGDTAQFARGIDPSHPITFEADRDPGGKADVIGLHYPHEPPGHVDYPNTTDWLGTAQTTDALGGMLGTTSGEFLWDRKKPLYIGEYLWDPQGDFSDASIFYGDEAYENRDKYQALTQLRLFYEQTVAYRRANVSGLCPWTIFGFGIVSDHGDDYKNQQAYYRHVAAFLRDYGLRCFAGEDRTLTFDVFNDGPTTKPLALKILDAKTKAVLAERQLSLDPGGYQAVSLSVQTPASTAQTAMRLVSVLQSGADVVDREPFTLTVTPRSFLTLPKGATLVTYDPSHIWPNSVGTLAGLAAANARTTLLIIAPHTLDPAQHVADGVSIPVIGAGTPFDTQEFHAFLNKGGRALVLEQSSLQALGLGVGLSDKRATMAFPLQKDDALWAGLGPDDLKYWRGDNYVADAQIRRPESGGGRALAVTGGDRGLDTAPVVDLPYGASGRVMLMQALVGEKRQSDPAAHRVLQNAVTLLAASSRAAKPRGATVVLASDGALAARLTKLGLDVQTPQASGADLNGVAVLALHGSPPSLPAAEVLSSFMKSGGTLYWLDPDPATLSRLAPVLGGAAGGLDIVPAVRGAAIDRRQDPLFEGVSREDLTCFSVSDAWDHPITWEADATDCLFLPHGALASAASAATLEPADGDIHGGTRATVDGVRCVSFDRSGDMTVTVPAAVSGMRPVTVAAMGTTAGGKPPIVLVFVNDVYQTAFPVPDMAWAQLPLALSLTQGRNVVSFRYIGGGGAAPGLRLGPVRVGAPATYPSGAVALTVPSSLVTWRQGAGRVVLDGGSWLTNQGNAVRANRYANALFANLGAAFVPAPDAGNTSGVSIPFASFHLVGDSPYYSASPDEISLLSNGMIEAQVFCKQAGSFRVQIQGYSTPYQGTYALARVALDGTAIGDVEIKAPATATFAVGPFPIGAGTHKLEISFTNDAAGGGEDRNLYLRGVGIESVPSRGG